MPQGLPDFLIRAKPSASMAPAGDSKWADLRSEATFGRRKLHHPTLTLQGQLLPVTCAPTGKNLAPLPPLGMTLKGHHRSEGGFRANRSLCGCHNTENWAVSSAGPSAPPNTEVPQIDFLSSNLHLKGGCSQMEEIDQEGIRQRNTGTQGDGLRTSEYS